MAQAAGSIFGRTTGSLLNARALFLAVAFMIVLAGCAKPQYQDPNAQSDLEKAGNGTCVAAFSVSKACIGLTWETVPTETTFGSFVFTVKKTSGVLADIVNPKVILWMPSMGHGSSPVVVERISTGVYRASNVFFTMKGDWEIRFQTTGDQAVRAITL